MGRGACIAAILTAFLFQPSHSFILGSSFSRILEAKCSPTASCHVLSSISDNNEIENDDDVLNRAIALMSGGGIDSYETPDMTQARIAAMVNDHKVLLFMKGAKFFPQCGFSDTATKILDLYDIDYHTVNVLSDPAIRDGVKTFSQWPTIPQVYVDGEFLGGSDILLDLHQRGELKSILDKSFGRT